MGEKKKEKSTKQESRLDLCLTSSMRLAERSAILGIEALSLKVRFTNLQMGRDSTDIKISGLISF